MNRFSTVLVLLFSLAFSNTIARNVKFSVVSFGSSVEVQIGSEKYPLTKLNNHVPLYQSTISVNDSSISYKYIVDDVKEDFTRTLESGKTTTHNEFFGRKDTVKELPQLPTVYEWKKSVGKGELFDDSYIPTVHITGNNTEKFFHKPKSYSSIKLENVKFYLKDTVESFSTVSASAKNYEFSRFQIKMKLGKNKDGKKGINGRYILKLRNGAEDPLNLRQLIYGNIIEAIGMPSLHSVMVRVYYNKKPAGFYTLQETVPTDSFVNSEFYGNPETQTSKPPKTIGNILDGTTGSDFEYKPNDLDYYSVFDTDDDASYDKLIAFCKALSKLNTSNEKDVKEFESKWFDIDTFHKAMAMEYLTGDWDGYWYTTSNFAFYDDPQQSTKNTFKYYFITQDHDETFGVGLEDTINKVGKKFPTLSYTTMLNRKWHIVDDDAEHRTLVDKFIGSTPALQQRFQNTLVAIVQTIFNPVAFRDVVGSYYDRYEPEVKWDYSFTRPYVAKHEFPSFNYDDFKANFESGIDGLDWGLYEWVELRAEAIKKELCISWEGDQNPPSASCVPKVKF